MNLTVKDIAAACGGEAHIKENATSDMMSFEVSGVYLDSRLVNEGSVFVAQKGERVDGHSFIASVFEKGAALVICEMDPKQVNVCFGTDENIWGSYIVVEDSLTALKQIAKAYREKLSIPFVGITGSVGKTSTKEFIAGVLSEKYNVLKTEGNYNNEIGVPLTLLKIREEHEVAVVEMGISDFGEMTRLTEMVQPNIAVITNIGQCHLENLKSRDGILKAKTEIFGGLRENGRAVLFGGDDKLITVGPVNDKEPLFFGESGSSKKLSVCVDSSEDKGLFGSDAQLTLNCKAEGIYSGKCIDISNESINVSVPLPGHHMVVNAAAAATVAMLLEMTTAQIKSGIENMKPIVGRNNIITVGDIVLIDDCYNANPVSMKSSIDLLKLSGKKCVAVLGDMFELGKNEKQLHREVGNYAAKSGVEKIYCIGELSEYLGAGASEYKDNTEYIGYWNNKEDFIKALKEDFTSEKRELIPRESAVLVKASHGMHFEEIVKTFKEICR
ncbi:MAG: UDP-N-acetylmuramoyl-tripeptide--D-alanyl-D-alanine ligase [Lachnospiraceae bacterium]|nr:UDP-N-acetylmuramoyl-tripeptide--D-alanyl-D-alanine ligase [Lachnospiraceae bacterium]